MISKSALARWPLLAVVLLLCGLAGALIFRNQWAVSSSTAAKTTRAVSESESEADESPPQSDQENGGREVYASWYEVPPDSLARRRAGVHELTAAHDRLPLGTLVRVTHLENGKSVTVRITDRGIHRRKVKLDLCKEAARDLGMISEGIARVRMEVVPEENGASPPSPRPAAP